jgi:clan AA aspartic protease
MVGIVTAEGEPIVQLPVAGQTWTAVIDTGFNGDVELPESLRPSVNARFVTQTEWSLASGQRSIEDTYEADFPFDGETLAVEATFATDNRILLGTHLLRHYRLLVDFPARTVLLEKVAGT